MSLDDRNAALDEALEHNPIDKQIAALVKAGNRLKFIVIGLAFLTVFVAVIAIQARQAATKAENAQTAVIARCEATNEARIKNRDIWNYVLELSNRPNLTPQQLADRDKFVAKLDDTFKPTDCKAVKK